MASPADGGRPGKAEDVLALLRALDLSERRRLFKALEGSPLLSGTKYVLLPQIFLEAVELLQGAHMAAIKMAVEFGKMVRRIRPPDRTRLERGQVILQAHRGGVSWKKMPSHVLGTYPEWFPTYRLSALTQAGRQQFAERLRRMARDAQRVGKP